jgi:hypothetical protein
MIRPSAVLALAFLAVLAAPPADAQSAGGLSLRADSTTLPEGPGTVNFQIDLGPGQAGSSYLLAIGISGATPGTPLPGGLTLPVNWDPVTDLAVQFNNQAWFYDFWGTLDAEGKASPRLEWPGVPGTAGLVFDLAACTAQPFDEVTNGWQLTVLSEPVTPSKEFTVAYIAPNLQFKLATLDFADPEDVTQIGNLGLRMIRALEYAGDGTLYAYESPLWNPGRLYEVDPATASLTPIGPISNRTIEGMAYNPVDGKMYGVASAFSELLTIDLATGAQTVVGTMQLNSPLSWNGIYGLGIDDQGSFYLYNNAQDTVGSGVSAAGLYKSTTPGGLQFQMVHDLKDEFGVPLGTSLQVPAPLFVDWSSGSNEVYGWCEEQLLSQTTGWFTYHLDAFGQLVWNDYPEFPLQNTRLFAWTAPPTPADG